ncbi:MAG TPA: YdeI/OmpD-associated family protein [Cytophagaceae bacterium]
MADQLLVNKEVQLEKFSGKGGWTFARLPEVPQEKSNPFGWRKVKGFIDDVEIKQYHLMPMGNGQLFLPVKAAIRKKIKKEAGDWVKVVLYEDNAPLEIPEEFLLCLKDEPVAYKHFQQFSVQEQKKYIEWIYSVKTEQLKIDRMALAINKIAKGEKFSNNK